MEIYTDKAQNKVIIVTDERGLENLRAACIAYSCDWTRESEKETIEHKRIIAKDLAAEYDEYWQKMYDAGKPFRNEE